MKDSLQNVEAVTVYVPDDEMDIFRAHAAMVDFYWTMLAMFKTLRTMYIETRTSVEVVVQRDLADVGGEMNEPGE